RKRPRGAQELVLRPPREYELLGCSTIDEFGRNKAPPETPRLGRISRAADCMGLFEGVTVFLVPGASPGEGGREPADVIKRLVRMGDGEVVDGKEGGRCKKSRGEKRRWSSAPFSGAGTGREEGQGCRRTNGAGGPNSKAELKVVVVVATVGEGVEPGLDLLETALRCKSEVGADVVVKDTWILHSVSRFERLDFAGDAHGNFRLDLGGELVNTDDEGGSPELSRRSASKALGRRSLKLNNSSQPTPGTPSVEYEG
ncbi:unnamed protein product, partial [Discosporangium mesarthrocarpum]